MLSSEQREAYISTLAAFPDLLESIVICLTPDQLNTPYLDGEWTVAQNIHHLADSHMNSFIRLKLILTEDAPMLKPYDQDAWALTADYNPPIEYSLMMLRGLHARWVALFQSLTDDQWSRIGQHPEAGEITPESLVKSYHNHCHAHLDQITRTLAAGGITVG
jgi:hypothetical protein